MKKIVSILILALSCTIAFNAYAQGNSNDKEQARKEKWEKFRQDKHDFYIQTMELTPEQAEKFIPLYDEMEKLKFEANRELRHQCRAICNNPNVTDEQYKAVADEAATLDEKVVKIEKEYYVRFCEILTPRQQFLYHRCEPEFQKKMAKMKRPMGNEKPADCKK